MILLNNKYVQYYTIICPQKRKNDETLLACILLISLFYKNMLFLFFRFFFYVINSISDIHPEDKIRMLAQNMRSKHQDGCNGRRKDHS